VLNAASPASALVLVALAFVALGTSVRIALVAYAVAQVGVFAASFWAARIAPERPSRSLLGTSFRYGLRGFVGNFFQVFNYRLDLFLVSGVRGASAAGVYSVAVFLAELLWKIAAAASTILFPRVAAERRPAIEFTLRVGRVVVLATSVAAIATVPIAAWIVLPLLPDDFSGALTPLALLLPGVVALALAKVLAADLSGRGNPQYSSYASGLGLAVTLALMPPLVAGWGASGAATASTASYVASTLFFVYVVVRRFGVSLADVFVFRRRDVRGPRSQPSAAAGP
jgi:O-antigen/teichoic acid export membrane protein